MKIKHKSNQLLSIEKALQKVKSDNGKFISHELVIQWLESWGTDNEIKVPINYKSK